MDIIILVLAILVIGVLCYKNVPTLLGGIIVSIILLLIYKMDIYEGLLNTYMGGFVGFAKSWLIMFTLGALFGKLLEVSGGADSLARTILNLVGPKNVSLGVALFTTVLCAAGVSSFVTMFVVYPIALKMCREANLNRASVVGGYTLGLQIGLAIPWVPVTNNVLCASYFGTDVSAGGVFSFVISIITFVVGMVYLRWYEKRLVSKGLCYAPAYGTGAVSDEDLNEGKEKPHWVLSVIPMLIPILVLNILKVKIEVAMLCGVISIYILQFKYLPHIWEGHRDILAGSINMSMTTIVNAAGIVGLATVIQACPGYEKAVAAILSYNGSPLMISFIATNMIAGIAGSSSAGLVLAAPVLQEAAALTNPAIFHRLTVFSSLGFDSLPNAGFLQTECTVAGVKFKDMYLPVIFMLSVVLTIGRCIVYMVLCSLLGMA